MGPPAPASCLLVWVPMFGELQVGVLALCTASLCATECLCVSAHSQGGGVGGWVAGSVGCAVCRQNPCVQWRHAVMFVPTLLPVGGLRHAVHAALAAASSCAVGVPFGAQGPWRGQHRRVHAGIRCSRTIFRPGSRGRVGVVSWLIPATTHSYGSVASDGVPSLALQAACDEIPSASRVRAASNGVGRYSPKSATLHTMSSPDWPRRVSKTRGAGSHGAWLACTTRQYLRLCVSPLPAKPVAFGVWEVGAERHGACLDALSLVGNLTSEHQGGSKLC